MKNNPFYELQLLKLQAAELLEKSKQREKDIYSIADRLKAVLLTAYTLCYQLKDNYELEREIKNIAISEMQPAEKEIRLTAINNILNIRYIILSSKQKKNND